MVVDLRCDDGDSKTSGVQIANGAERRRVGDLVTLTVAAIALLGAARAVAKGSFDIASAA